MDQLPKNIRTAFRVVCGKADVVGEKVALTDLERAYLKRYRISLERDILCRSGYSRVADYCEHEHPPFRMEVDNGKAFICALEWRPNLKGAALVDIDGGGGSANTADFEANRFEKPSRLRKEEDEIVQIGKEFINSLPSLQYEGCIEVVSGEKAAKKAVRELLREHVLGFDTERCPCYSSGNCADKTVLVQLCGEKRVYLFRLELLTGGVSVLFPIFENPKILKVGIGVEGDVSRLKKLAPFTDAGFVDVCDFVPETKIKNRGLQALCAYFLRGKISKAQQRTNWRAESLCKKQILYAATDAWAGRELFMRVQDLGFVSQDVFRKPICKASEKRESVPVAKVELHDEATVEQEEIMRHKCAGRNLGYDYARQDGLAKHRNDWQKSRSNKNLSEGPILPTESGDFIRSKIVDSVSQSLGHLCSEAKKKILKTTGFLREKSQDGSDSYLDDIAKAVPDWDRGYDASR